MKLNAVERSLERFHYHTFQVPENPLDPFEKLNVTFPTNAHGESSTIQANRETHVKEIVFTRAPEKRMFETSFRAAAPSRLRRSGAAVDRGAGGRQRPSTDSFRERRRSS
jgi:hypothetical protein